LALNLNLKTNLDNYWCGEDVDCDYKCDTAGTGNRSTSNKVSLYSTTIEYLTKKEDTEAKA